MPTDLSITPLQNTRFHNKYKGLIHQLAKETIFCETQVTCYLLLYYKFAITNHPKSEYMTLKQLGNVLQIYYNLNDRVIIENILRVLSTENNIIVTPTSWIKLLEIYSSPSLDYKIRFCFNVYDIHQKGYLERFVVTTFIQNYFIGDDEDSEDYTLDMLDILMRRFDNDKDGMISFDDYRTTVLKTPKLMQFLGICIPYQTGTLEDSLQS